MPTCHAQVYVYNTLSRRKEALVPLNGNKINFFVCGPTVYDFPHLGHAKTYTQFDFIVKFLRLRGYDVYYLQNVTDIDDKIIQRAQRDGINWQDLARKFEEIYLEDMRALHNDALNRSARATDHIPQIVAQVTTLLEKGFAYQTTDGIYFDLSRFGEYGKLSKRTHVAPDDSVSRIDDSSQKRNPGDFCLWKNRKEGEPFWSTPLGDGRPGWHIEDTAITEHAFGPQYDMHGGAVDLIFPHHEAEIAQMECCSGRSPLVKYWLHTGFLNVDSEKMSKSKGNFKTIRDALEAYSYRVLRFCFLSQHYRSSLDFTEAFLEQGAGSLKRLDEFIFNIRPVDSPEDEVKAAESAEGAVIAALSDDFNAPKAFAVIFDYVRARNSSGGGTLASKKFMLQVGKIFDILGEPSAKNDTANADLEIDSLVAARLEHRRQKRFSEADQIRDELARRGIVLYDSKEGVKWRRG